MDSTYGTVRLAQAVTYRSILAVPMLRDGHPIGTIAVARAQVGLFSAGQIALLQTFADQAVIAIENVRLFEAEQQRTRELTESLEQQTATSEVLKVISRSAFDLQPVFDTMAENAVRLCEAERGFIFRFDGKFLRLAATYNVGPEAREFVDRNPIAPGRHSIAARAAFERRTVHVADVQADPEAGYAHAMRDVEPFRTVLAVPMLKDDDIVGTILIYRLEVKPFADKQVALVETFAAQAVIAIENTRLLNELRQRTTELTELLEQQTATSEVLQVISSSPGDLEPVFSTVLEKAVRICEAKFGMLYRNEGGRLRLMAVRDVPPMFAAAQGGPFTPAPGGMLESVMKTGRTVHLPDLAATQAYLERHPIMVEAVELGGVRTVVGVPMINENELVGLIGIYRQEVRPFTDKQVALLTSFASQAVIAIENTRLLNELRESLQQQTATADVLKVISRSTFNLQTVLNTLVESAARLCEADMATALRIVGTVPEVAAAYGMTPELQDQVRTIKLQPGRGSVAGRALLEGNVVHVHDVRSDPEYTMTVAAEMAGARTMLGAPLLREGVTIGLIVLMRRTVRPFTQQQIELLSTFADQAVIAIENTRLFEAEQQRTRELTKSLEQQTATSEVLGAISGSPGELDPVFKAILENAARICQAQFGTLNIYDGSAFRSVALHNPPPQFAMRLGEVIRPHPESGLAYVARTKQTAHINDIRTRQPYLEGDKAVVDLADLAGARTLLIVPMLKEGRLIGTIAIYRREVRPFTDKQIELVQNFASQAVIAIENTRLLNELRQRTDELDRSVGELRALGEVSQAVNSTLDIETVLSTIVAKAVQLSGTEAGAIYVFDDLQREFHLRATYGMDQELIAALTQRPYRPRRAEYHPCLPGR